MAQEGAVLGHIIFDGGIAVDKAKMELIERLPPPVSVKRVRSLVIRDFIVTS